MALLFPLDEQLMTVLTVRPSTLKHHGGQISFPGGRRESGETHLETALRECEEEIGISPDVLDVLGPLTPLYIPPSNFCVYPFVASMAERPLYQVQEEEVDTVLEVPVNHLLKPVTRREAAYTLQGQNLMVPYYAVDEHQVWGATAAMLAELLAMLSEHQ